MIRARHRVILAATSVVVILGLAAPSGAATRAALVSRTTGGMAANGNSSVGPGGALSGNGKLVVFHSRAANLPGGDGVTDRAYVRNMSTGTTRLVSKANDGSPANGSVRDPAISADGRFVVFTGTGSGLPGANGHFQVWIRDLSAGKTRLVSRSDDGEPGDGNSGGNSPGVSAHGRFVVFPSYAANLPGGDGTGRVYVRDVERGTTILVSRTNGGAPAEGYIYGQAISGDGRFVTFQSSDPDLPGGDGHTHIYLRDLERRRTILIDRKTNGAIADGDSNYPSISADGRFVEFESDASNLPGVAEPGNYQVYLRDRISKTTKLVSRNTAGAPQDGGAFSGHISSDGRYVAFIADGTNLPGGHGATALVYLRDMKEKRTRLLSKAADGSPADGPSQDPSISNDGRFVAFMSLADNLPGNDDYTNVIRAGPVG
jgi:TolB protein